MSPLYRNYDFPVLKGKDFPLQKGIVSLTNKETFSHLTWKPFPSDMETAIRKMFPLFTERGFFYQRKMFPSSLIKDPTSCQPFWKSSLILAHIFRSPLSPKLPKYSEGTINFGYLCQKIGCKLSRNTHHLQGRVLLLKSSIWERFTHFL